jgi:hypothetical protein
MSSRLHAAVPLCLAAAALFPAASLGAQGVEPRPGAQLSGRIHFPRAQGMALDIDAQNPSRAKASLGFDGRCKGGGFGEFWAKFVPARETVRIKKNGRFSAKLTGETSNVGGVPGRNGTFRWRLKGRFLDRETATATVSGKAEVRMGKRVVSRCKIAKPSPVRLTLGG